MRGDVAFNLERGVGRVLGRALVRPALFVPPPMNVGRPPAGDRLDRPEHVIQQVTPVAHHVRDDAASVFRPVVPRGTLCLHPVPLEHPVPELAAHGEDPTEEARIAKSPELHHSGKPQLVLHHAVLDTGVHGHAPEIHGFFQRRRRRLLHVHVFPGCNRFAHRRRPSIGRLCVEIDVV